MNIFSKIWLSSTFLFEPVQTIFNGSFWEVFVSRFGDFDKDNVVDLACGTGELRKHINPKKYIGIDINPCYINFNLKNLQTKKTNFVLGNLIEHVPKKRYNTALLISAMHHLSDGQINTLCESLKKSDVKKFIIIDGYPKRLLRIPLMWLDGILGKGKYFRKEEEIVDLIGKYFKVVERGILYSRRSLYYYPYVIASVNR